MLLFDFETDPEPDARSACSNLGQSTGPNPDHAPLRG
jgi:hypothetical protein